MAQDPATTTATTTEEKKTDESKSTENIVRDLDLVIYGATGFTGQYLAKYLAKRCATTDLNIKWGIAGRNQTKLNRLHNDIKQVYENNIPKDNTTKTKDDINNLPILIGDVTKLDELKRIALRTKLIISCVGPYRFYGENVVLTCVNNGTHYIDICGEPEFMDRCASKYFDIANKNNSIVIHACGFDSIPSDMGTEYINQLFLKENGLCSNVEVYMTFNVPQGYPAHVTTFEAAVHGFSSVNDLRKFRKELENVEWRHSRKKIARVGPKQKVRKETYFWSENVSKWSMIFPFADSSVVNNSQGIRSALLSKQNKKNSFPFPQFAAYLSFNSKMATYQAVAVGGLGTLLTKFNWGKNLLLNYPEQITFGAFSHNGPTEEQMNATTFSAKLFGQGYSKQTIDKIKNEIENEKKNQIKTEKKEENENENTKNEDTKEEKKENKENKNEDELLIERLRTIKPDLKIKACVNGCDPGYKATAIMSVESALCLLADIELIRNGSPQLGAPPIKGGVFTPSAVFSGTTLMDRLTKAGVEFKMVTHLINGNNKSNAATNNNNNNNNNEAKNAPTNDATTTEQKENDTDDNKQQSQ